MPSLRRQSLQRNSVQFGESGACREQELVAGVLQVVLVVSVVDDALQVAFVVAHLQAEFVDVVHIISVL